MEVIPLKSYYPPFYDDSKQNQVYCSHVENLEFSPHFHEQIELLYVLDGEIEVSISGTAETLKKRELAIAFPQKIHSYQSSCPSQVYLIIFPADLLEDFRHIFQEMQPVFPFLQSNRISNPLVTSIQFLFQYIHVLEPDFAHKQYYTVQKNKELKMTKGYLQILLCHLFEQLDLKESESATEENSVLKCIRYVTDHYQEPMQLADIARYTGLSRVQISRIFTKKLGYSFPDYLNSLRLNHAAHLLQTTDWNILDICCSSGFDAASTFYYYFKKKYEMSPKEFRKIAKQE